MLTVADTDIIKEIMVKQFSNFTDRWVGCVIVVVLFVSCLIVSLLCFFVCVFMYLVNSGN